MKHYILTRFNLGIYDENNPYKKWVGDPDVWMAERMRLFEKYTLPSINKQTCNDFIWVLSVDENTPYHKKIELGEMLTNNNIINYTLVIPNIQPHFWIREWIKSDDYILTSRLDNDDYYMPELIEKVQGEALLSILQNKTEIIDIDYIALEESTGNKYTSNRTRANSPFLSLVEPWTDSIHTCMARPHTNMIDDFPGYKINEVLAVQVIHGNNVSNKIVGRKL